MREERLLERLANVSDEKSRRGASDVEVATNSVLTYVKRILNTRQGSVEIDPSFGVPDYSSMAARFSTENRGTVDEIETAIRDAILKWEPRIASARTKFMDKAEFDITLTIEIEVEMIMEQGIVPFVIKANISPSGRVDVYT